jgi:hypothetical protein
MESLTLWLMVLSHTIGITLFGDSMQNTTFTSAEAFEIDQRINVAIILKHGKNHLSSGLPNPSHSFTSIEDSIDLCIVMASINGEKHTLSPLNALGFSHLQKPLFTE